MRRSLVLALVLVAVPATSGHAAVTIGQTAATPSDTCGGGGSNTAVQIASTTPNMSVPSKGVITGWSIRGRTAAAMANVKFTVWREDPTDPGYFQLLGITDGQTVPQATVSTFPARIPAEAGDVIGLNSPSGLTGCTGTATGAGTDRVGINTYVGLAMSEGFTAWYQLNAVSMSPILINAAATLEPDADADGYGDETQDLCASDASIQTACPVADPPAGDPVTTTPIVTTPAPVVEQTPVVPPVAAFAVAAPKKATVKLTIPAAGKLSWLGRSGGTTVVSGRRNVTAGSPSVTVSLNAKGRKRLKKKGKLKVAVTFTFTPAGGTPVTRSRTLTFKR
jgi:hypothetical protein